MDKVLLYCFVSTNPRLLLYHPFKLIFNTYTFRNPKNSVVGSFVGSLRCCGEVVQRSPYFFLIDDNNQHYQSLKSSSIEVTRIKDHLEWEAALKIWKTILDKEPELESFHWTIPDELDFTSCAVCLICRKNKQVVAAGRYIVQGVNVEIDRVAVLPEFRGQGIGRSIVQTILRWNMTRQGAIYVRAMPHEMGFYSILGFECQSYPERWRGLLRYKMVYKPPICNYSSNCVGIHHMSIRVSDIEKSLAFYGILGFILTEKFISKEHYRACFLQGMGIRLELIEDTFLFASKKNGSSVLKTCSLAFDVTKACVDLESYLLDIRRRNGGILYVRNLPQQQVIGGELAEVATIEDPDKFPLEFIRRHTRLLGEEELGRMSWE
jgi:GNAT superfamily N-acetyltransferase